MATPPGAWMDEIDLDPHAPAAAMGTRALGSRSWLVRDDQHGVELALKRRLHKERRDDVLRVDATCTGAGSEVLRLLRADGAELVDDDVHPLERAGLSVQEDLCLMRRLPSGWHLAAGSVCFPSRWRLAHKVGLHVTQVHEPAEGYAETLATRVDRLFDGLRDAPVWRRNWFVHPDPDLFQPDRPANGDPVVAAADVGDSLYLRSERQTLRRLDVEGAWILFTIRIQQTSLGAFAADADRRRRLVTYLTEAQPSACSHHGLGPPQVFEVLEAVGGNLI